MSSETTFVLIHSPLAGPITWQFVAEALQQKGYRAIVPSLSDHENVARPFWTQHVISVYQAMQSLPEHQHITLVAHSGAGPLLPAIRDAIRNPVDAYVFVDAGMPQNGASRLDLLRAESEAFAAEFDEMLRQGGTFPNWRAEDLAALIPDETRRQALIASLRPRSHTFFTEPIPVSATWPDAPCAYLQWSETYASYMVQARAAGWLVRHRLAGHFHMLVDASGVAAELVDMTQQLRSSS